MVSSLQHGEGSTVSVVVRGSRLRQVGKRDIWTGIASQELLHSLRVILHIQNKPPHTMSTDLDIAADGPFRFAAPSISFPASRAAEPGREEEGRDTPPTEPSAALPGRDGAGEEEDGDLSRKATGPNGNSSSRPPLRGLPAVSFERKPDAGTALRDEEPPPGEAARRGGTAPSAAVGLRSRTLREFEGDRGMAVTAALDLPLRLDASGDGAGRWG